MSRIRTEAVPLARETKRRSARTLRWVRVLIVNHAVPACHTCLQAKRLLRVAATKLRRPPPVALSVFPERPLVSALLSWAQAACAPHSLRLENFTSAFGDGRAICYIVSHAHTRSAWCVVHTRARAHVHGRTCTRSA